jgi:xylulokinase
VRATHLLLSHDLGTTGDKATLFRADGTLVASAVASYPTSYPKPGWAEQDANEYWGAFCRSTRELLGAAGCRADDIAVVSFSGQMMAALPVDALGEPLRPSIIWADQRATAEAEELARRVPPERIYALTGHRVSASYSAAKIMWIRANEPEVFRRAVKFLHAKDFVACRLTGRMATDYSDASGMNLLDIGSLDWSREMLDAAGLSPSLLPDLYESTAVVGKVTAAAAATSGLVEGTPVAIGGGDGACATCGAGVIAEGDAYICLGTSAWMATASRTPLFDPRQRTFTFCHFARGLYFPCGSMQAAGGSLAWFMDTAAPAPKAGPADGGSRYEAASREVEAIPAGCEGLLFLPYLMGERSPWWNSRARGSFVGLSMRHGRAHMLRAVMEGVALNMRLIADAFRELGREYREVRMLGGGARSAAWRRIFADVLETPVTTLNFMEEATSLGAAIAGGVATGVFPGIEQASRIVRTVDRTEPDPSRFPVYRKIYPAFTAAYRQLAPVFEMIAKD